jgi:aspartyl-tRNA(Asn)/glutamyl-tRNA(Gln) amidotransferase subunit B
VTAPAQPKRVANWVTGELLGHLKAVDLPLAQVKVTPAQLGALVGLIAAGTINSTAAKTVFSEMLATGRDPETIVAEQGLSQVSDEAAIAAAVDEVIAANPKVVADIRAGNQRAISGLIGPVMKKMGGRANNAVLNRIIAERVK